MPGHPSSPDKLQAVILVGGLGTRLGPLTADVPKPLLPVGGRPFLDYLLARLDRFGFDEVILLAGYKADQVDALAARFHEHRLRVTTVSETAPAGTAGALLGAAPHLADTFLMMNGDSLFDVNWLDLACFAAEDEAALATLALRAMPDSGRYGSVRLTGDHVTAFAASAPGGGPALVNSGVYWMDRRILDHVPKAPCSLERDIFPGLAEVGRLRASTYEGFFLDIGVPDDFDAAATQVPAQFRTPGVLIELALIDDAGEGAGPAIRALNNAGLPVWGIAVTVPDDVERLRHDLNARLRGAGAHLDRIVTPQEEPGTDPVWPGLDFGADAGMVLLKDAALEESPVTGTRRCQLSEGRSLAEMVHGLTDRISR